MKDRIALRHAINAELARVKHCHAPDDRGFNIRILIRVLFSSVDAYCHYLKQWVLQYSDSITFSKTELEVLREGFQRQTETGSTEFVRKQIGAKQNLLTTFKCLARTQSADSPLPASGDVIPEFQTAIGIRHRITHPKSANDFLISSKEAQDVASAVEWFIGLVQWAATLEDAYIRKIGESISQSIDQQIDEINRNRPKNENA